MSCPLAHETLALAMRVAGIFFLECRDSNHRTNMAVTAVDGYEGAQESECINPVGFHPTCPPIDLEACGIKHPALDANLGQQARQPEAVISGLVTYEDTPKVLRSCSQPTNKLGKFPPVIL